MCDKCHAHSYVVSPGMILFANPQELATAVGGNDDVAIVFAITSLWIYNIGLNIAQVGIEKTAPTRFIL